MPRKQTSPAVSSLAARLLASMADHKPSDEVRMTVRTMRRLCASLVSQDETKGQAGPRRRKR